MEGLLEIPRFYIIQRKGEKNMELEFVKASSKGATCQCYSGSDNNNGAEKFGVHLVPQKLVLEVRNNPFLKYSRVHDSMHYLQQSQKKK